MLVESNGIQGNFLLKILTMPLYVDMSWIPTLRLRAKRKLVFSNPEMSLKVGIATYASARRS